ncbi:MAG: hypothetical protein EP350_05645 [Alphaproteobacteria bacterium]|nr:MAG: hypothetical protein EP350_05645 [Alphaproteobacteria bacterium]
MNITRKSIGAATVVLGALAVVNAAPSLANHAWSTYHWQTSTATTDGGGVAKPDVIDNTTGVWNKHVADAMIDWNSSDHISSGTTSGTTNQRRCPMTSGTIQVCNTTYGQTGWLGIASISISGGHIVAGSTKLNDTYFNTSPYNTSAWRQLVACQEIGHDYGLGHQDENFNNTNLGTCMDYTGDPDGSIKNQLPNLSPNAHDYAQLAEIYNHSESGGGSGGGGAPGGGKGGGKGKPLGIESGNSPADWGRAIGRDGAGRDNLYVRNVNGYTVVTHVLWAIGEGPGPRQHSGDHHFDH